MKIAQLITVKISTVITKLLLQEARGYRNADPRIEWCSSGGSESTIEFISAETRPMTGTVSVNVQTYRQLHSLRRDLPGRIISE